MHPASFRVVVDLGFGDSGKGMLVDTLASESEEPVVVKYSGGPQCGHTVVNQNGHHVHSSFPSGTLGGYDCFSSKHCPIYVPNLMRELASLRELDVVPNLFVDPLAPLITPYDVHYGRVRERVFNHGSCGMGVGATMNRHNLTPLKLYAVDLLNKSVLIYKLKIIFEHYKREMERLKHDLAGLPMTEQAEDLFKMENLATETDWLENCPTPADLPFAIVEWSTWASDNDKSTFIMEGGQGVMLDAEHGLFPHVTYGNTTCRNAVQMIMEHDELGEAPTEMWEVARCYQTRHGRGPYTGDSLDPSSLINTEHETNTENEWQGPFTIHEMDPDLLAWASMVNMGHIGSVNFVRENTVITCVDQRPDFVIPWNEMDHHGTMMGARWISDSPAQGIKPFEI